MRQQRKSIGNKLRFEVLKRDGFACHYCGARPPDVQLEVDHIEPVALGGSNDISNLVAACVYCNSGKCAVPLDDVRLPPANSIHEVYRRLVFRVFEAVASGLPDKIASAKKVLFKFNWCEFFGYRIVDGDVWPDAWTGLPDVELVEEALRTMDIADMPSFLMEVDKRFEPPSLRPCDCANMILRERLGKEGADGLAQN